MSFGIRACFGPPWCDIVVKGSCLCNEFMRKNWDSVFSYPVWARVFDTCPVESFKEGPLTAAFNRVKISDLNRRLAGDDETVELCKFFPGHVTNL